jgi:replicative DNA helicase
VPVKATENPEAELGIIGCCLIGGLNTALAAIEALPGNAFTRQDCEDAFMVIQALAARGDQVGLVTLNAEWPRHHKYALPPKILDAAVQVPSAENLPAYLDQVKEATRRREVAFAGHSMTGDAVDAQVPVDDVVAKAEALLNRQAIEQVPVYGPCQIADQLVSHLRDRWELNGKKSGIETGFTLFDNLTDGLQAGELAIIGARPSQGKTALGLNIVERACIKDSIPTLFVTCEMSTKALMRRLLSSWGTIPMTLLKSGGFVGNKIFEAKLASFNSILKKSKLQVIEALHGTDSVRLAASIRRVCRKHGIKLVVVDYLQKIRSAEKQEKRTYEVAEVSGTLKALAIQTNAAFLVMAQLNRESEKDKGRTPRLSDLADSGQIERDADLVALLYRNKAENQGRDAQLIIAKQRDGELGCVKLLFEGTYCRFENLILDDQKTATSP